MMALCSLAALCELLWAVLLVLCGKIKGRIKKRPKFTEPEAGVGTLVSAGMPDMQKVISPGLENGLDHDSLVEQMHPCPRNSDGFQVDIPWRCIKLVNNLQDTELHSHPSF